MTIRTRLKRLENWAKHAAPDENDPHRREVLARQLDRLSLEALKLMREAFRKKAKKGKAGDPDAPVKFGDLDLPEDFRQQLTACLRSESVPAGSKACCRPDGDQTSRAPPSQFQ